MNSRWYNGYWAFCIFSIPFYMRLIDSADMRLPKDFYFIACVWLGLILFGLGKAKPLLIAYCAGISILSFFHQHAVNSANVILHWMGINTALLLVLAHSVRPMNRETFLNTLAVTGLCLSIWVLLNRAGVDLYEVIFPAFGKDLTKMVRAEEGFAAVSERLSLPIGPLFNSRVTAAVIAACGTALLRKKWIFLLPIVLAALAVAHSAAAFLGLAAGAFVLCLRQWKRLWVGLPLLLSPLFFLRREHWVDLNGRMPVWLDITGWFRDPGSILFGRGTGYFPDHYVSAFPESNYPHAAEIFMQAHNEYLELYVYFGLIGLAVTGALILFVLLKGRDLYLKAILVSCLAMSAVHFYFHISAGAVIGLIAFAGLFASMTEKRDREREQAALD